jgi:type I restriction enzyme M protein
LTYAAESPLSDTDTNDDLHDEFLGAIAALGGSAGNGRLRETLEWEETSYEAVKADLLDRRVIGTGRGRGGSVALADGSAVEASGNGQTELDYTEQTSWMLFLKYLDGLEDDKAAVALLEDRTYSPILEEAYRWNSWAAPKNASGQLDQRRPHRRRPARLREPAPVPLPGALKQSASGRTRSGTRSVRSSGNCATRSAAATT